jgi:hypothetical protein
MFGRCQAVERQSEQTTPGSCGLWESALEGLLQLLGCLLQVSCRLAGLALGLQSSISVGVATGLLDPCQPNSSALPATPILIAMPLHQDPSTQFVATAHTTRAGAVERTSAMSWRTLI